MSFTMPSHRLIRTAALLAACTATPSLHAACFQPAFGFAFGAAEDDYAKGTAALDQQHWQDAITAFDRVILAKTKKADAALYWKAYALNKLGRPSATHATCTQLQATYPDSTWNNDCKALALTVGRAPYDKGIYVGPTTSSQSSSQSFTIVGPNVVDNGIYLGHPSSHSEAGSEADLKMLALNSVLQRDPSRAIPVIRDVLNGNNSNELKHRALSVLGMSQSPDAQALLRDVATGKVAPTEQRQAISMLGVFQGKRAGDTLSEIYRTTSDRSIKRSVISSMFVAGDAPHMVDIARSEKDLQLKHDIVAQLALMKDKAATDYMLELLK